MPEICNLETQLMCVYIVQRHVIHGPDIKWRVRERTRENEREKERKRENERERERERKS